MIDLWALTVEAQTPVGHSVLPCAELSGFHMTPLGWAHPRYPAESFHTGRGPGGRPQRQNAPEETKGD